MSITSPADGDGVSGASVTITADATDDNGVEKVEFWVDSTWMGEDTDGTDGWSAIWDLTSVAEGNYTIAATASDGWQTDSVGQGACRTVRYQQKDGQCDLHGGQYQRDRIRLHRIRFGPGR